MKKIKRWKSIFAIVMAIMMSLALVACGGGSSGGGTESGGEGDTSTYVWDFLDLDSAAHPMVTLLKEWSDEIYAQTDGRLKINIRVGGELPFTTAEYLDAVSSNSVQMAGCMITAISSYLQAGGLPGCPYMTTDIDSFNKVMGVLDGYLESELSTYGVFNAMTLFYPTQDVYGKGSLPAGYADLKGLKIRTSGAEQAKFWQKMGLVPTSIDASEVSSALNTNIINGVTTATLAVDSNKWYETLDWVYMCNSMIIPVYAVVSEEAFNELPVDIQEIFLDVTSEFNSSFPERMQDYSDQCLQSLEDNGLEVVWATDQEKAEMREVAMPLWDEYAASAGGDASKALAEIKNALGLK